MNLLHNLYEYSRSFFVKPTNQLLPDVVEIGTKINLLHEILNNYPRELVYVIVGKMYNMRELYHMMCLIKESKQRIKVYTGYDGTIICSTLERGTLWTDPRLFRTRGTEDFFKFGSYDGTIICSTLERCTEDF